MGKTLKIVERAKNKIKDTTKNIIKEIQDNVKKEEEENEEIVTMFPKEDNIIITNDTNSEEWWNLNALNVIEDVDEDEVDKASTIVPTEAVTVPETESATDADTASDTASDTETGSITENDESATNTTSTAAVAEDEDEEADVDTTTTTIDVSNVIEPPADMEEYAGDSANNNVTSIVEKGDNGEEIVEENNDKEVVESNDEDGTFHFFKDTEKNEDNTDLGNTTSSTTYNDDEVLYELNNYKQTGEEKEEVDNNDTVDAEEEDNNNDINEELKADTTSYVDNVVELFNETSSITEVEENEEILDNDKDLHGCIPSAGYAWCESTNECVRVWETKCDSIIQMTNQSSSSSEIMSVPKDEENNNNTSSLPEHFPLEEDDDFFIGPPTATSTFHPTVTPTSVSVNITSIEETKNTSSSISAPIITEYRTVLPVPTNSTVENVTTAITVVSASTAPTSSPILQYRTIEPNLRSTNSPTMQQLVVVDDDIQQTSSEDTSEDDNDELEVIEEGNDDVDNYLEQMIRGDDDESQVMEDDTAYDTYKNLRTNSPTITTINNIDNIPVIEENDNNGYVATTSYTMQPTSMIDKKNSIAKTTSQQGVNPDDDDISYLDSLLKDYDTNTVQIIGGASLAFVVICILCCIKRSRSSSSSQYRRQGYDEVGRHSQFGDEGMYTFSKGD